MSKLIFVSGHGKTGTSSVVGMLNASPQCLILYEAYLCQQSQASPRGQEFLQAFPWLKIRKLGSSLAGCYRNLGEALASRGSQYEWLGDKILADSLSPHHWQEMESFHVIYMVRDLRTWLCKNIVVMDYQSHRGLADKATAYVAAYLQTFRWPHCLRVSMEAFLLEHPAALERIFAFLQLPISREAQAWWKSVGSYPAGSPKAAVKWWRGHDSSKLRPSKLDTTSWLKKHGFWDEILPLFDKYYRYPTREVSGSEVTMDLDLLAKLADRHRGLALEDLYERVDSVSFGSGLFGGMGHQSSNPHAKPFRLDGRN